jgi:cell division protein FtsB
LASIRNPKTKLTNKFYILPFFLIIAYILFLLGRTVWQNYKVNKEISTSQTNLENLKIQNKTLQNQIEYYQSASYREEQARSELGYQKPGEKVFVIPSGQNLSDNKNNNSVSQNNNSNQDLSPNYQKWWQFLFK